MWQHAGTVLLRSCFPLTGNWKTGEQFAWYFGDGLFWDSLGIQFLWYYTFTTLSGKLISRGKKLVVLLYHKDWHMYSCFQLRLTHVYAHLNSLLYTHLLHNSWPCHSLVCLSLDCSSPPFTHIYPCSLVLFGQPFFPSLDLSIFWWWAFFLTFSLLSLKQCLPYPCGGDWGFSFINSFVQR